MGLLALLVPLALIALASLAAPAGLAAIEHPSIGEREKAVVEGSCGALTITMRGFPDAPGNNVNQLITSFHRPLAERNLVFDGPTGTNTIAIPAEPSLFPVDVRLKWDTNGIKGSYDILVHTQCPPGPAFSVEKRQRIADESEPESFTTSPRQANVGQTIEYKMIVTNFGNVALTFTSFTDPHCDAGTLERVGPDEAQQPGGETEYVCSHVITPADLLAGTYSNTVTVTATPTEGGEVITHPSNTVIVNVFEPGGEKGGKKNGGGGGPGTEPEPTPSPQSPGGGVASSSGSTTPTAAQPKSGVLAFSSQAVPTLAGRPQGCVRGAFVASLRSAGVKSVTFYLDGHKLKTLTARNARKGKLSISINTSRLKIGSHRLQARITMTRTSNGRHVQASRSLAIVRCHSAALTPRFTG